MSEEKKSAGAPPPPRELQLTVDGEDREIVMSFGLQRELVAAVGTFDQVTACIMDTERVVQLMSLALTKREKNGRPEAKDPKTNKPVLYDAEYAEITDDDRERLLVWIMGHVTDFFMKRLQQMETLLEEQGPEFARLNSSAIGLRDSILRRPAPGPSKSSPES